MNCCVYITHQIAISDVIGDLTYGVQNDCSEGVMFLLDTLLVGTEVFDPCSFILLHNIHLV